ncbi:MAG: hypothetical protein JSV49_05505 [Thermoplasmata archaeon]|nr:MAG: hypothetical protein JSV49_05505 [Thermoplasmata archaeon]
MQIIVKCGSDECRSEFRADIKERDWICPNCDRVIPNKNYPFLTAQLMEAKTKPDEANWKALHEDLLQRATELVKEREDEIAELKERIEKLEKKKKKKK